MIFFLEDLNNEDTEVSSQLNNIIGQCYYSSTLTCPYGLTSILHFLLNISVNFQQ